ncbi:PRTRC system protein C [Shewanella sp. UCD-KL12]|uniref:PRTRC system protein C n=1 Tax=Shewanella sp. UCD-KL12 TaxID=1917163 RepID=UPI000971344E|nr:PRTRC system protein C [Shewanella sp. UCD-KL12]
MISIQTLPRKFKIGATIVEDPAPEASLDEVQRILTAQYPMLRHTRLYQNDGRLNQEGTEIVYEFQLIPVKTKG